MENIYQQAVADAKAVRESAMANAKAAIQEAFEPKIKAMLKKHIVESEDLEKEYQEMEETEMVDNTSMEEEYQETMNPSAEETDDLENMDETTLDEILAELDGLEEADEIEDAETELEEAYKMEEAEEEDEEEETEEETEEESEEDEDGEESTEETKVVDITLGDLVDAIKAAMATEAPVDAAETGSEEMPADDDISLDEILAELEEEMKEEGHGADGGMYEATGKFKVGDTVKITTAAVNDGGKTGKIVSVKMGEKYPYEVKVAGSSHATPVKASQITMAKEDEDKKKAEKELEEAKKAITAMRAELNEINLLNAKLLYVNKIFKSKTLTEAQKVKVLNAFDRATTVKEAKNTYAVISESITAAPKKQLKESYGFASKPAGMAPKGNTMESDPFIARMQKLAGL
jgi:hypothetical protein